MSSPASATGPPVERGLSDVIANRRWWRRRDPHPHLVARDVLRPKIYDDIEQAYEALLDRGLSDTPDPTRLSRNMPNSEAYAWDFPPDIDGPLALFYTRAWHDLLARVVGVRATGDINAALHHHALDSPHGFVHGDLAPGWFSDQPRPDGINPFDLTRCSYTTGAPSAPGIATRETIRAVTMILYIGTRGWTQGDGGETGLYATRDTPVAAPDVAVPPIANSLLVFENTPASYHSFIGDLRRTRGSVILWLHRPRADVVARWGLEPPHRWGGDGGTRAKGAAS